MPVKKKKFVDRVLTLPLIIIDVLSGTDNPTDEEIINDEIDILGRIIGELSSMHALLVQFDRSRTMMNQDDYSSEFYIMSTKVDQAVDKLIELKMQLNTFVRKD